MLTGRTPRPTRQLAVDGAIAALLLGLGMAEIWGAMPSRSGTGSPVWSSAGVVLCTVPLLLRRIRPVAVMAVLAVGMSVLYAVAPVYVLFYGTFVPMAVAVFSVARHLRGRQAWWGVAWIAVAIAGITALVPAERTVNNLLFNVGGLGLVWAAGWALAVLERREAAARQRVVETEVAAATLAMSAVVEERTRIARELHDIVAHAVSLIVVQAGAAEPIVEEDPAFVRTALTTIRSTGVGALAEMRRMVTMLRDADDPGMLVPQPGVAALPELVARASESGLDASLHIDGTADDLPSGLDLTVYRIVQEALSNIRRHAEASRAEVRLTYGADRLTVHVCDDGIGGGVPATSEGHGLIGMRERAALYGGWVEASGETGRGFTVRASLPLAPT